MSRDAARLITDRALRLLAGRDAALAADFLQLAAAGALDSQTIAAMVEDLRAEEAAGAAELARLRAALGEDAPPDQGFRKTIWIYWNTGLETAPDVVRRSVATWRTFNPGYEVEVLDDANISRLSGIDFTRLFAALSVNLGIAGRSDLIRLWLLWRFGGVWVDATTFCLRPLDEWLPDQLAQSDFYCFRQPKPHGEREIVSWFMASTPRSTLGTALLRKCIDHLSKPRGTRLQVAELRDLGLEHRPGEQNLKGDALLAACEARGVIPYFWMFYAFSAVIADEPEAWARLDNTRQRHSQASAEFSSFLRSDVSKQTYKYGYERTPIYRQRVRSIFRKGKPSAAALGDLRNAAREPGGWQTSHPQAQISEAARFFFVHIPKCGGTSIDNSDIFGKSQPSYGHMRYSNFKRVLGHRLEEFRCFTLVRNPWDRLASAFFYLERGGGNPRDRKAAQKFISGFGGDFSAFVDALHDSPKEYFQVLHLKPATTFFDPAKCAIPHFVQKLEETADLGPLCAFLGIPVFEMPHARKGPEASRARRVYDAATFEKVAAIYADDVRAFGYGDLTPDALRY